MGSSLAVKLLLHYRGPRIRAVKSCATGRSKKAATGTLSSYHGPGCCEMKLCYERRGQPTMNSARASVTYITIGRLNDMKTDARLATLEDSYSVLDSASTSRSSERSMSLVSVSEC